MTKNEKIADEMEDVAELGFSDLVPLGLGIVVLTVVLTYGAVILADIKAGTSDSDAKLVAGNGTAGIKQMSSKVSLLVTVIVAAIILGILISAFAVKMSQ